MKVMIAGFKFFDHSSQCQDLSYSRTIWAKAILAHAQPWIDDRTDAIEDHLVEKLG